MVNMVILRTEGNMPSLQQRTLLRCHLLHLSSADNSRCCLLEKCHPRIICACQTGSDLKAFLKCGFHQSFLFTTASAFTKTVLLILSDSKKVCLNVFCTFFQIAGIS